MYYIKMSILQYRTVALQAPAQASPAPIQLLPGIGAATPSEASLPVRQLQFASAARCAGVCA